MNVSIRMPRDYDAEPLVVAITALDWSTHPATVAMRAIQGTVCEECGDRLTDAEAFNVLGYLLRRHFIAAKLHPDHRSAGMIAPTRRLAKYVRVSS